MARGQVFTLDYVIAVGIFVLVYAACIYAWNSVAYKTLEEFEATEMENTAVRACWQLTRTPGSPADWEADPSTALALGLAPKDRVLSQEKFNQLSVIEYEKLKNYLGVGGFDFNLRVTYINGSFAGEVGKIPASDKLVSVRRIAVMGNETVFLDFRVWNPGPSAGVMPVR